MYMLVISDFLAGYKNKIFTSVRWQVHTVRIDEMIVFAQDEEIVSTIQVPSRHGIRMGISMATDNCMGVGVAFVPSLLFRSIGL
jgi:hypothetical protein